MIRSRAILLRLAVVLIQAYRFGFGWLTRGSCRFQPTCSRYAEECLRRHGLISGSGRAIRRVLRCHPFHPGGLDPVR